MTLLVDWLTANPYGNMVLVSALFWLTWGYCLRIKGWVSDDCEGMAKFSDRFMQQKDPAGAILKEELIDGYDEKVGDKTVRYKHTQFNPHIGFPGSVLRYLRLLWGRRFQQIGKNAKGHTVYGWVQNPIKHHLLNLLAQQANLILGYLFLEPLIGAELATTTLCLFAVHPIGVQAVGWISGVNYTLCLTFTLASYYIGSLFLGPHLQLILSAITTYISCLFFLPGCFAWIIQAFLGHFDVALIMALVGLGVLFKGGLEAYHYRVKAFNTQNMGKSTLLYWRKLFIIPKTIWYYLGFVPFPKRLGLFHCWGYHFEEPLQHADDKFYKGLATIIAIGVYFFFAPFAAQLGILWFFTFILIFTNLITAQQFVSERYAFIPAFGYCIVMAYLLRGVPAVTALIIGAYMMRVWVYLPTFQNEVRFYESNAQNFPDSEVALGNLGVAYLNHGLPGKAVDTWLEATRINPHYDVPWYNLYSFSKQQGDLIQAREFLKQCLNAKVIHFPDIWNKELAGLDMQIAAMQKGPVLAPGPVVPCQ